MIYINNDIKGYVSKIEEKFGSTYATVSTSRKDKRTDKYVKSYWTFKFVNGTVHDGKITITSSGVSKEKSEKDGKYYENWVAFKWEQEYEPENENQTPESMGFMALEDDSDIPF